jgi:MATE family multidrug resistance protein
VLFLVKLIGVYDDACSLETWYYRILILLTGNLKNAAVAVDALAIWYVLFA